MQPVNAVTKPVRSVGELISEEYYALLVEGYAQQHPTEQRSVIISKATILNALAESSSVCGVRFMYGLRTGDDQRSRTLVLMPCYEKLTGNKVPNILLSSKAYLTDAGDAVSAGECWEMYDCYVDRMCRLMPEEMRKDIPRGCFYGIDALRGLLSQERCAGIRYHFGYNPVTAYLPERYEAVLEAVDAHGRSLRVFMEDGNRCPTACGVPPTGLEILFGSVQKGSLFEFYHHASPAIIDAIQKSGEDYRAVYQDYFAVYLSLLAEGRTEEANKACKEALAGLIEHYLVKN
jgi:hypothetical protein